MQKRIAFLPNNPDRMLDAPGVLMNPYANILSWANGDKNVYLLAIALGNTLYSWDPIQKKADQLHTVEPMMRNISSVSWYPGYQQLAYGTENGDISIFDVQQERELSTHRNTSGELFAAQITAPAWNGNVLTYGTADGKVTLCDVRDGRHRSFAAHSRCSSVCTVAYTTSDPIYFASSAYAVSPTGGRVDPLAERSEVVQIWDTRQLGSRMDERPYQTLRTDSSTKGLRWTPWCRNTLFTGSCNGVLSLWNTVTGANVANTNTGRSINSVMTSPTYQEILTTHYGTDAGSAQCEMQLWTAKALKPVTTIGKSAHQILSADMSPDGETVCVATDDETLKFWQLFPRATAPSRSLSKSDVGSVLSTSRGGSGLR
jgi:WD40 repeat protein